MSVDALELIKQQIVGLSEAERHTLAEWLQKNPGQAPDNDLRRHRREWIAANRRKYGGLYVALDGDKLLGTGKNFPEALKAAKEAGKPDAFVDFVPPENYIGEIGGFE